MQETFGFMLFLAIPAAIAFGFDFLKTLVSKLFPQQPPVEAPVAAPRAERPRRADTAPAVPAVVAAITAPVLEDDAVEVSRRFIEEQEESHRQSQVRRQRDDELVSEMWRAQVEAAQEHAPVELNNFDYADFQAHEQHS